MSDRPKDVKYSKTHEWIRREGDMATVGITDFAIEHLGDLVFVGLPDVGRALSAKEVAAEVESVKAVGEVYAPLAGEVVEVNAAVSENPASIADDPYGTGWLFKLSLSGDEPGDLMDLDAYEAQLASDATEA